MDGRKFLILLLMLAFLCRLASVLAMRDIHKFHGPSPMGADAVEFNDLGLSLAHGHGYENPPGKPTAFRAPGFPFFLAAFYYIFGESYPIQYLMLCVIGAIGCGCTYLLGRELGSETFARIAGLLCVFYIPYMHSATIFASENVFALCLVVGTLAFVLALRRDSALWMIVAGLFFGWGILTRPFLLISMPFLALLVLWHGRASLGKALVRTVLLALACLAVVAPWTARNYRVLGKVVLVSDNGGSTFYGGNNDTVINNREDWGAWVSTVVLPGRKLIEAQPDEVSHDAKEWELGEAWVKDHLSDMPRLEAFKLIRFWMPDIRSANKKYVLLQLVTYTPFLVLFIVAAVRWFLKPRLDAGWLSVDILMLSCVATALIFWGSPRFRDGNAPLLMLYAATALWWIPGRWLLVKD